MDFFEILNLYGCLGGNRFLWNSVAKKAKIKIRVTCVEKDPELLKLYGERFPNDILINSDAHSYLLENYYKYNFIWASPPCPSHSRLRRVNTGFTARKSKATYPDMKLYQEIILLDKFFKGGYCVENVIPYYKPLIPGKQRGRHIFWTNFNLPTNINARKIKDISTCSIKFLSKFHSFDFTKYKGTQRVDKISRNLVDYEIGKTILETYLGLHSSNQKNQISIFDQIPNYGK